MNSPAVSVIMLAYNREAFVPRAVEGVLCQTFRDFEFIAVDNGSSDRSGEIAREYAKKDARMRVISKARGNIGSGRNAGLKAAKGAYIAFIDDDDYCENDYLEFLYGLAKETGADISICGAKDKAFDEKRVMGAEEALTELLWRRKYNVQFPTKLIKAELFRGVRFSETSKYDDIGLMPRIIGGAEKTAYHGLPKYTFTRHAGNNSAWTTRHSLLDAATLSEYLSVYRARTAWLIESFPGSAAKWRYFEWSFMISMVEKIERLNIPGCAGQLAAMKQALKAHGAEFLGGYALGFEREWMARYI